jgi:predicted Zn-ribbon and HTH transcriptional regulator
MGSRKPQKVVMTSNLEMIFGNQAKAEIEKELEHIHEWETTSWGVIIGASKCKKCGKISGASDFDYSAQEHRRDGE